MNSFQDKLDDAIQKFQESFKEASGFDEMPKAVDEAKAAITFPQELEC